MRRTFFCCISYCNCLEFCRHIVCDSLSHILQTKFMKNSFFYFILQKKIYLARLLFWDNFIARFTPECLQFLFIFRFIFQNTFAFEPLTHQSKKHFSAKVAERWCLVRMDGKGMWPDLNILWWWSISCNKQE